MKKEFEITETVSSELEVIKTPNHKEYGLEETKAQEISAVFIPMLNKMKDMEIECNEIIKLPLDDPQTSLKARELRLRVLKVRTGTAKIHKEEKAYYIAGGKLVDAWKNTQHAASLNIEKRLEEIEKHQEKLEKERLEKLQAERMIEYRKYSNHIEGTPEPNLAAMQPEIWNPFINGCKRNMEERIAAEKKAEADRVEAEKEEEQRRIAKEKREQRDKDRQDKMFEIGLSWNNQSKTFYDKDINFHYVDLFFLTDEAFDEVYLDVKNRKAAKEKEEAEEQERIRVENERLKKEAADKVKAEKLESERLEKLQADRSKELAPYLDSNMTLDLARYTQEQWVAVLAEMKRVHEDKIEAERKEKERLEKERLEKEKIQKEHQEQLRIEKRKQEAKLEKERKEKERIEAELQAKKDEEKRLADEKAAKERQAKLAPDKEKLIMFKDGLLSFIDRNQVVVESEKAKSVLDNTFDLLDKTVGYLNKKIEQL